MVSHHVDTQILFKNNTGGHLFQGRFKSIIVENDANLLRLSCYIHRNPLRAGIVGRLVDYPWSSYRYYAYQKKPPEWLCTKAILDQASSRNPHKVYRVKVQKYSDEKVGVWEDVKNGLIYGGQEFVQDIKERFLGDKKEAELTQHNSLLRTFEPEQIIKRASEHLGFNLEAAREFKKIGQEDKDSRDLIFFYSGGPDGFPMLRLATISV